MSRGILFRILIISLFLFPLLFPLAFFHHFAVYLTGNIITDVIVSQWHIVVISIAIFAALLIPLSFRRKANWVERGLVVSFFVSLFVEMYGIPLTIILASNAFFVPGTVLPEYVVWFEFLGVGFGMDMGMTYGAVMMSAGIALILLGWSTLYLNRKQGMVASGIYSLSRHPQNLGLILVVIGWFVAWPTILTLVFAPILVYRYVRLSRTEEKEMSGEFPSYREYKKSVPALF